MQLCFSLVRNVLLFSVSRGYLHQIIFLYIQPVVAITLLEDNCLKRNSMNISAWHIKEHDFFKLKA